MRVLLLTRADLRALPALYSQDSKPPTEVTVWVKLFTPDAQATWYLTELDPVTETAFGWCDLGLGCPELGYVSIRELRELRGPLGLPVERDRWWSPCPLSRVMDPDRPGPWGPEDRPPEPAPTLMDWAERQANLADHRNPKPPA